MEYERYNYPPEYQDAILACLVAHPASFMPYAGIFNSAYFTGTQRIATARALFAYWRKNGRFPSWKILSQIVYDAIARTSDEKDESTIMAYVRGLEDMDTGDHQDVAEHVIGWARRRALYIAIDQAFSKFQAGENPSDGFIPMFEEALRVGTNIEDFGYFIGPDEDRNDIARVIREYTDSKYAVSTGFPLFDNCFPHKGLEPGWLIAVLAPPKRYKTTFCINLAMNIAKAGKTVFYYPCEISQTLASIRTLCNLTDRSIDAIMKSPNSFTELALAEAKRTMGASLLIKGYPSKGVSIGGEIRSHAINSVQQLEIKNLGAIVIDFAETVRSSADPKKTSDHRAQSEIFIEARALAHQMKCPVIMPDRCNRETVEQVVPTSTSFQGSFEKSGIVDVGLGLCASEQEYIDNQLRYFIFLNRHGEASQHFRGSVDPRTQRLGEWVKIPWNPEEEDGVANDAGRRQQRRRQRHRRVMPPDDIDEA